MKRRLLILASFLLLGAVVNVAVAWGCALVSARELATADLGRLEEVNLVTTLLEHDASHVITIRYVGMGVNDNVYLRASSYNSALAANHVLQALSTKFDISDPGAAVFTDFATAIETQVGWPMRAMTGWRIRRKIPNVDSYRRVAGTTSLRGAMEVTGMLAGVGRIRLVPMQPLWLGSAANTLFYAAILWLLIPGPFALRRFLRLRRGLCPKCAYPIGESSVCTECGNTLPARVRAVQVG